MAAATRRRRACAANVHAGAVSGRCRLRSRPDAVGTQIVGRSSLRLATNVFVPRVFRYQQRRNPPCESRVDPPSQPGARFSLYGPRRTAPRVPTLGKHRRAAPEIHAKKLSPPRCANDFWRESEMADVAESGSYADAASAISQGKRHLLVQDYTAAVTAFAEGLEMMSQKLGDCDDELGEPYLLYGRALLGLAREEAGVLGGGVPGSEDAEEDEDGEDEEAEDEKLSDVDEKDEESEETDEKKSSEASAEKKTEKTESEAEKKDEEKKTEAKEDKPTSNETDDKKIEEQKKEEQKSPAKVKEPTAGESNEAKKPEKSTEAEVESVAGSSKVEANGSATKAEKSCNGAAGKSEEAEDGEDVSKEDDEEDPGRGIDLQVAWEVLELAKIVFTKRGETGLKNLAETHRLLGEVAMESDNPQGAITDLEGALKLLQKMEPCEPRAIAELHYQLGLAHSLLNDFDASIGQFKEATTLLEARIKQLEGLEEPAKNADDPFYTIEGEIKELKELLPAIQEKIADMKDFKQDFIEGIKNQVAAGGCTNGAGSSNDGAGSSSSSAAGAAFTAAAAASAVSPKNAKPASDISHLVRKKRKAEEVESPAQSPCKKPTP